MKALTFFIDRAPESPNRWRKLSTRARMSLTKAERNRAYLAAHKAAVVSKIRSFTGPAHIKFEVHRHRLLDELVNLPASLKQYQDGVCKVLLPAGDGPGTSYTWHPIVQVQVAKKDPQGVLVMIEEAEEGDPPDRRVFSGNPA